VDGAIHRAAGRQLLAECRTLGGCPTGEARITGGYHLPARHVIHTVGPVWHGGRRDEDELLASCYQSSLALVVGHNLRSIAFPAISTGIYRFPAERAARIALTTIQRFLTQDSTLQRVILVAYNAQSLSILRNAATDLIDTDPAPPDGASKEQGTCS